MSKDPPEMRAEGAGTIDPRKVQDDLDALEAAAADVKVYVDKVLARADSTWSAAIPGPEVVDSTIQLLGDLLVKYTLILRGVDLKLTPVPEFNWTAIFREAWLPG